MLVCLEMSVGFGVELECIVGWLHP